MLTSEVVGGHARAMRRAGEDGGELFGFLYGLYLGDDQLLRVPDPLKRPRSWFRAVEDASSHGTHKHAAIGLAAPFQIHGPVREPLIGI